MTGEEENLHSILCSIYILVGCCVMGNHRIGLLSFQSWRNVWIKCIKHEKVVVSSDCRQNRLGTNYTRAPIKVWDSSHVPRVHPGNLSLQEAGVDCGTRAVQVQLFAFECRLTMASGFGVFFKRENMPLVWHCRESLRRKPCCWVVCFGGFLESEMQPLACLSDLLYTLPSLSLL